MDDRDPQNHSEYSADISAYIDGELSPDDESKLEVHLATCDDCTRELNLQKSFLRELSSSLDKSSEIDIPKDFTRSVVTNAESQLDGLRRPRERFNAVFICVALGLFALFALGPESDRVFAGITKAIEKVFAILYFAGRLAFDIAYGVTRILQSVLGDSPYRSAAFFVLATIAVLTILVFLARAALRQKRTVGS